MFFPDFIAERECPGIFAQIPSQIPTRRSPAPRPRTRQGAPDRAGRGAGLTPGAAHTVDGARLSSYEQDRANVPRSTVHEMFVVVPPAVYCPVRLMDCVVADGSYP